MAPGKKGRSMAVHKTQSSAFCMTSFPDFHHLDKLSSPIGYTSLKEHVSEITESQAGKDL